MKSPMSEMGSIATSDSAPMPDQCPLLLEYRLEKSSAENAAIGPKADVCSAANNIGGIRLTYINANEWRGHDECELTNILLRVEIVDFTVMRCPPGHSVAFGWLTQPAG